MLVLSRKLNEAILIGDDIRITLVRIAGDKVRIGIEAPRDMNIVREELTLHLVGHGQEDSSAVPMMAAGS